MPEVAEWLIATDLKSVVRVNAPGVRIPLSPHHESPLFAAFTFSISAKSPDSRQGFFITSYSFSYLPDHRYTAMQLLYSISSSIQSRTRWGYLSNASVSSVSAAATTLVPISIRSAIFLINFSV
jgi:hypothetical protein